MSTPELRVTTGFATGAVVGLLTLAGTSCQTREAVDSSDTLQCTVRIDAAVPIGVRTPVRFLGADGVEREYRVRQCTENATAQLATLVCGPPIDDLALAGSVRGDSNGETIFALGSSLTVSQWLVNYVLINLAVDGLSWLSATPGVIDNDVLVTLQWTRWNRMQLLQAIVAEVPNAEVYLTQSAPGALYQLNVGRRNGSLGAHRAAPDLQVVRKARESTDNTIATVVEPFGAVPEGSEEPATMAEAVWQPNVLSGGWVQLLDPSGGAPAVGFLDQFNGGLFLEVPSGAGFVYRPILDTDLTDSSVNLADTSLMSSALTRVRITRTNTGLPLTQLTNPQGLGWYGRVVSQLDVEMGRGERNWFPDPCADLGGIQWAPAGGAYVEAYPKSEYTDVVGAANGAKTTGTPAIVNVDGMVPGTVLRRGTTFQIASTAELLFVATTTTVDGAGQAAVPTTSFNIVAIPDNAVITFFRNTHGFPGIGGVNVLRLQGLTPSNIPITSNAFLVGIRGAYPRTVWFRADLTLFVPIAGTIIGTSPISVTLDVLDASGTLLLGETVSIAPPVESDARPLPVSFSIAVQLELAATQLCKLRLTCSATSQAQPFFGLFATGFSVHATPERDVPLVNGSHSTLLHQRGNRELLRAHVSAPNVNASLVDLSQIAGAQLVRDGLQLGQSVYFADFNVTQRAVAITREHFHARLIDVQCTQLPLNVSEQLAA